MSPRNRESLLFSLTLATLVAPSWLNAQVTADTPITILQTTDLHHHANGADHVGLDVNSVTGTGVTGAYSRISAYVSSVRATAGHPVLLVDSGDWTMGTLYDLTLSTRPLALSFLDLMNYDCVTLGNHEFDYAPQGLARILQAAQTSFGFHTPVVASNMNLGGSPDLAPFVGAGKAIQTTMVEQLSNGLKIGYIGLMGKSAASDAPVSAPVTFSDFSANYSALQALVDGLRKTQGVQVVIALSHSGTDATGSSGEDVDLARHVTGIDVIASGHTHTPIQSARSITNGSWTTQIIDAGAYGANVSRIDITYHPSTNSTSLNASANPAMTDASLSALQAGLVLDKNMSTLVASADQQLNVALGPFFKQVFPDYDGTSLAKGIYHPVGSAAQTMATNAGDPVPAPNGVGDLAADSTRAISNSIVAQTLMAAGGNPANLPSYDFTPYQAGIVASGVLRGKLLAGVPLSFADIYNVEPLGISPDPTQTLPVGYPLVSAYLELADLKKLCALQLVVQSGLGPGDDYLNLSGLKYGLKTTESYTYFKYATAAGVLQTISQKVTAGSVPALTALTALTKLPFDNGTALLIAYALDNPYAGALVKLNDPYPTASMIATNLNVLGQVGVAAITDATTGGNSLSTLIASQAISAIDTVSAFGVSDGPNTGTATVLTGSTRVRIASDLFAVLALGAVQQQFGVAITVYKAATGTGTLSAADLNGVLANRINASPSSASVQELKPWMTLLSYLSTGLNGNIGSGYASTSDFTQFPAFGAAVQTRNASYPLASIAQLVGNLGGVQGTPVCGLVPAPAVFDVTSASYSPNLPSSGTIIVWGTGFYPEGGNSIILTNPAAPNPITLDITTGSYFWDLSGYQINATVAGRITPGQWTLTVKNACGAKSAGFGVIFQ